LATAKVFEHPSTVVIFELEFPEAMQIAPMPIDVPNSNTLLGLK
jgi:hypothetical protein